jgi:hypothetical protein
MGVAELVPAKLALCSESGRQTLGAALSPGVAVEWMEKVALAC